MDTQREPVFHPEERKNPTSLAEFAQQNQITEERVWEMIEEGTVAARFVNDSILILKGGEPAIDLSYEMPDIPVREQKVGDGMTQYSQDGLLAGIKTSSATIPLIRTQVEETAVEHTLHSFAEDAMDERGFNEETQSYRSFADAVREAEELEAKLEGEMQAVKAAAKSLREDEDRDEEISPEPFFPDLDPAAENSREILLFAQDALARNESLSRQLLSTKDELLRMKDERIQFLETILNQKEKEIRTLSRQVEELVTLKKFEHI